MPPKKHFLLRKTIAFHAVGWSTFILYEISLVRLVRSTQGIHDFFLKDYVIPYLLNIGLFYFHALFTVPRSFGHYKRNFFQFGLLVFLEIAVYMLLMGMKEFRFLDTTASFFSSLYPTKVGFIRQLWRGIYFLIFATAYWLIQSSFEKERRLKNAEKKVLIQEKQKKELALELLSSQNAFLQAQINPHLLFNTLNFIQCEVQESSPKASEAIIILADMMRYSLSDLSIDGKIELEKEVEQVENLIQINRYRFDNGLFIQFNAEGDFDNVRIVPLLLVPFVENLLKYGDLTNCNHPAQIDLKYQNNVLRFATFNQKRKTGGFASTRVGIKNVTTRLNSSYQGRYSLKIDNQDSTYCVNLTIQI